MPTRDDYLLSFEIPDLHSFIGQLNQASRGVQEYERYLRGLATTAQHSSAALMELAGRAHMAAPPIGQGWGQAQFLTPGARQHMGWDIPGVEAQYIRAGAGGYALQMRPAGQTAGGVYTVESTSRGGEEIKKSVEYLDDAQRTTMMFTQAQNESAQATQRTAGAHRQAASAAQRHMGWIARGILIYGALRTAQQILSDMVESTVELESATVRTMVSVSTSVRETEESYRSLIRTASTTYGMGFAEAAGPVGTAARLGSPELAQYGLGFGLLGGDANRMVRELYAITQLFPEEDISRLTDTMIRGWQESGLSLDAFLGILDTAGPIASKYDTSVRDIIALNAALSRQLGESGDSLERFVRIMRTFYENEDVRRGIESAIGEPIATTEGVPTMDIIELLQKLSALSKEQREVFIQALPVQLGQAYQEWMRAILSQWDAVDDTMRRVMNTHDDFEDTVSQVMSTAEVQIGRAKTAWQLFLAALGEDIQFPTVIKEIADALEWINEARAGGRGAEEREARYTRETSRSPFAGYDPGTLADVGARGVDDLQRFLFEAFVPGGGWLVDALISDRERKRYSPEYMQWLQFSDMERAPDYVERLESGLAAPIGRRGPSVPRLYDQAYRFAEAPEGLSMARFAEAVEAEGQRLARALRGTIPDVDLGEEIQVNLIDPLGEAGPPIVIFSELVNQAVQNIGEISRPMQRELVWTDLEDLGEGGIWRKRLIENYEAVSAVMEKFGFDLGERVGYRFFSELDASTFGMIAFSTAMNHARQMTEDQASEMQGLTTDIAALRRSVAGDIESTIMGIMTTPSPVTAEELLFQTPMGQYQDKFDEPVRQLRAVVNYMTGQGPKPEYLDASTAQWGIPQGLTFDQLKGWAQGAERAFYNFELGPEMYDMEALAGQVEQRLQTKVRRGQFLQAFGEQYGERFRDEAEALIALEESPFARYIFGDTPSGFKNTAALYVDATEEAVDDYDYGGAPGIKLLVGDMTKEEYGKAVQAWLEDAMGWAPPPGGPAGVGGWTLPPSGRGEGERYYSRPPEETYGQARGTSGVTLPPEPTVAGPGTYRGPGEEPWAPTVLLPGEAVPWTPPPSGRGEGAERFYWRETAAPGATGRGAVSPAQPPPLWYEVPPEVRIERMRGWHEEDVATRAVPTGAAPTEDISTPPPVSAGGFITDYMSDKPWMPDLASWTTGRVKITSDPRERPAFAGTYGATSWPTPVGSFINEKLLEPWNQFIGSMTGGQVQIPEFAEELTSFIPDLPGESRASQNMRRTHEIAHAYWLTQMTPDQQGRFMETWQEVVRDPEAQEKYPWMVRPYSFANYPFEAYSTMAEMTGGSLGMVDPRMHEFYSGWMGPGPYWRPQESAWTQPGETPIQYTYQPFTESTLEDWRGRIERNKASWIKGDTTAPMMEEVLGEHVEPATTPPPPEFDQAYVREMGDNLHGAVLEFGGESIAPVGEEIGSIIVDEMAAFIGKEESADLLAGALASALGPALTDYVIRAVKDYMEGLY